MLARPSPPAHGEDRREAAEDQAPGVERDRAGRLQHAVGVHPGLGLVQALLVRPDLPGEDDLLAGLGGDGAAEVGLTAVGNLIFPAFDDFQASVSLADRGAFFSPVPIGFLLLRRDRNHQA